MKRGRSRRASTGAGVAVAATVGVDATGATGGVIGEAGAGLDSRPRTSNDNAFSEAQFKTMKYRPTYPRTFEGEADARAWCREFFRWYNHEHRHEGLALLTPADVHFGRAEERLALRAETLAAACEQHPERFVKETPTPKRPCAIVAIDPQPPREESIAGATSIPQAAEVTK